jgi:hypothetical protein
MEELARAVLKQAIADYIYGNIIIKEAARNFFFARDGRLEFWCLIAKIDVENMRKSIVEYECIIVEEPLDML